MRVGIGFDLHRLIPSTERILLPIGGIEIAAFSRVEAHSDGDVLLHSLVDALLGAMALGDIGQWFPPSDPQYAGKPSHFFVERVMKEISALGFRVKQIDSIVFLEEPKLAPFVQKMRERLAALLNLELMDVSVKAKTMESMGVIGEGKALAAQTVVTLEKV